MASPPAAAAAPASNSSSDFEWGSLSGLQALLAVEEQVDDGSKDRKQTDLALTRQLASEDFQPAIKAASVDQLDLALAHDALAIERKPYSHFTLLYVVCGSLRLTRERLATDDHGLMCATRACARAGLRKRPRWSNGACVA